MSEETQYPDMLFYCRDCQWIVKDPVKHAKKYEYKCPLCKGDRVAFGTGRAVCDYFHIKDSMLEKMLANPTKNE